MQFKFNAYGNSNISGKHKTTFEFTKDKDVTLNGDCIIGVDADFNLKEIKNFIENCGNKNIKITIIAVSEQEKIQETIFAEINPDFDDDKEFVIRKTNFASGRTFAIKANKAAFDLNKELISFLKEKKSKITVFIENKDE